MGLWKKVLAQTYEQSMHMVGDESPYDYLNRLTRREARKKTAALYEEEPPKPQPDDNEVLGTFYIPTPIDDEKQPSNTEENLEVSQCQSSSESTPEKLEELSPSQQAEKSSICESCHSTLKKEQTPSSSNE